MSTIVLRSVKGTPLTNSEVDTNFSNLNTDKYQSGSTATFASVTNSGLTSGRVTYAGASGLLSDSANLIFDGATLTTSNGSGAAGLIVNSSANTPYLRFDQTSAAKLIIGASAIVGGGAGYDFYGAAGIGLTFFTNAARKLDITSAGLVGIGTSNPSTIFTINGNDPLITLKNGDVNRWQFGLENTTSNRFVFYDNTASAYRLILDSDGDLGIGATNPVAKLQVKGSGTSGQVTASFILENSSSGTGGMDITGSPGASRWRFLYGGGPSTGTNALTESMCILTEGASAGNVGIGTSSPAQLLTLNTAGADTMPALGANGGKLGIISGGLGYGLVIGVPSSGTATLQSQFVNGTASALDMSLQPLGGLVGIGTSSLTAKLEVKFDTTVSASNGAIGIENAGSGEQGITFTKKGYSFNGPAAAITYNGSALGVSSASYLSFRTNAGTDSFPTERMRIDSSGNLVIGDTTGNGRLSVRSTSAALQEIYTTTGTGYAALEVKNTGGSIYIGRDNSTGNFFGSGTGYASCLFSSGAYPMAFFTNGTERARISDAGALLVGTPNNTTNGGLILDPHYNGTGISNLIIGHASTGGNGNQYMIFNYNGTGIGSITQSGTTAVLYNVTSDQRLKTNVVDAPSGNIDDIKIRSFDWVADGTHQEYGMVAQELLEVAPYAVYQPLKAEEMMAIDYSKLIPMMIKEIQDLKQRILTLENK